MKHFNIFSENELYGLKDKDGHTIVPCIYTKILDFDGDGYVRVLKGDIYGTVDFDGNIAIPHDKGLKHLGVFYNGAARARNSQGWGLVDEHGEAVTKFSYTKINAHFSDGYVAYDENGVKGFLTDKGDFSVSGKHNSHHHDKIVKTGVFHHDIAPALTESNKWIFVNRQKERVNKYEYNTLDTVLREGLYTMAKDGNYGAALFDGTPFNGDWYERPLHFCNGLSSCTRSDGKEGVVKTDGSYLFPCIYNMVYWNDYDKKDCWFAEDDKACYLLYPNGAIHIYYKRQARRPWNSLAFIPHEEINNYISEKQLENISQQKILKDFHLEEFDEKSFTASMNDFLGVYFQSPLQIYYRDTDCIFPIKKYFKRGRVLRAGRCLEATKHILCPVHRVRFMIASRNLISVSDYMKFHRKVVNPLPFAENVIFRNAMFMVYDVFECMGKTQIVLLQLPEEALHVAEHFGFKLTKLKAYVGYEALKDFSRRDFLTKMSMHVHGHSLSPTWARAMEHPVGLDDEMKPVPLQTDNDTEDRPADHTYDWTPLSHFFKYTGFTEKKWHEASFVKPTDNGIQLILGDITCLKVDAIVNVTDKDFSGKGHLDKTIRKAAGKMLEEVCEEIKGCKVGECRITEAYDLPCKKIIHVVGPMWHGNEDGIKVLALCYENALQMAEQQKLKSIAFPCIGTGNGHFPPNIAANTAWDTIKRFLKEKIFSGDIIICCFKHEAAQFYETMV